MLPTPKPSESEEDFVDRCVLELSEAGEYEDDAQREAVCRNQWEDHKGSDPDDTDVGVAISPEGPLAEPGRALPSSVERRGCPEIRVLDKAERKIGGYAVVWGALSEDLGGFRERFRRGAFGGALRKTDVLCLVGHDTQRVLGRTSSGTLQVREDATGLWFECQMPDTSYSRDLIESVSRGDVRGASFAFRKERDEWEKTDSGNVRTVVRAHLFEVSPTPVPAYPDTSVALRSLDYHRRKTSQQQAGAARRARLHELELNIMAGE